MTVPYATEADVAAWLGEDAPADATRLIGRAGRLVDSVVTARYQVDADGIPTDPTLAAALRDAVCAQVEQWAEADLSDETLAAGWTHAKIGSVSISRGEKTAHAEAVAAERTRLTGDAVLILRQAGLV